ncbi:MAG: alpha/beta fold hydrolase [Geminicoccaceae bacterium]
MAANRDRHGPRPLALHIARAEWAWRTGNPDRLKDFYRGIEAYRRHPYRRKPCHRPTVWQRGGCRLLDFGPEDGWPLLTVPSLINRAYILDLMPGASLLDYLGANGIRPLLLDWGDGTTSDKRLTMDEVIIERMLPAFDWLCQTTGKRPMTLGYCMGGTLSTALACLRRDRMAGLALLAAPWDFDDDQPLINEAVPRLGALEPCIGLIGAAPVDLLQSLFVENTPLDVPDKFARFANMAPMSEAARRFVAIEDWLNDGVALNAEVAAECFLEWYGGNAPARGTWQVDGCPIRPDRLDLPTFLAVPEQDRIVTPRSALALAGLLQTSELVRPKGGHVSMVAGIRARTILWERLLLWLKGVAAMQKKIWQNGAGFRIL